jgi:sugar O-acyltransferase (sialic acid O-acetyltransferase NeuD family)
VKSSQGNKPIALIGYSGHAYVAADIFLSAGHAVTAYCDNEEKVFNPFSLKYLGKDSVPFVIDTLKNFSYFIAIGDNNLRRAIYTRLGTQLGEPVNAIHKTAVISASATMGNGVFVAASATINPLVKMGNGIICNTSCSIDHECLIGDFAHIAPGAVLCGNVTVGENTFVGANAVIRQGISVGKNVMIGAGAVVVKNIPDNSVIIGNPQKNLK